MRMRAAGILCLLCACTSNPMPPNECLGGVGRVFLDAGFGGAGGSGSEAMQPILLAGEPAAVTLLLDVSPSCSETPPVATSADSSVLGPDNLPVASTNTGLTSPGTPSDSYMDTVNFTPATPGNYHLQARFQPNLGIVQEDLRVALDRRGVATHTTYDDLKVSGCVEFTVTAHGTLLCTSQGPSVFAFRDNAAVDSRPGDILAVHGDSVWIASMTSTSITHFTDTGSGPLVASNPASLTAPSPVNQLVPGDDDVLVLMTDRIILYALSGGAWVQTREWTGAIGAFAAARGGDNLVVATASGVLANAAGTFALHAIDTDAFLNCVGYGPEGLWFGDNEGELLLFTPGNHSPSATLATVSFAGWADSQQLPGYGALPVNEGDPSRTYVATWDAASSSLFLSWWGASRLELASASWVVLRADNGDIVVKQVPAP